MKDQLKEINFTQLIIARHNEATIKDAAKSIGISERTAHRWLEDPDFLSQMSEFNRQTRSAAALIVAEGRLDAYRSLVELSRTAKSESVRLKAILSLIRMDFPFLAEMEMDERIIEIEEKILDLTHLE